LDSTMGTGGSPLDPIFWAHHCMVDYCWAKWNLELGNNNTNDAAWINTNDEHFVDADGNPTSSTAGITTLMPLLSYQYESSAIGSSPATAKITKQSAYNTLKARIEKGANIRFDIKRRVSVAEREAISIARPTSKETKVSPAEVAGIINSDTATERIFASIEFAQLPPESDFSVRVFVNLPNASVSTPQSDPHYAGSFAFFGTETMAAAAPAAGATPGARPTATPAATPAATDHPHQQPKFLVNITDTIQRLRR